MPVLKRSTWIILALSIVILGLIVMNRPRQMTEDYPVKFDVPVFDFGKVRWGTGVTQEFSFRNVSDRVVVVQGVDADCGCTDATVSSNTIPSGQAGTLRVTFSPNGFDGSVTRNITLRAKDYFSETKVRLLAEVTPSIRVAPQTIDWGKVTSPQTKLQTVELQNTEDRPIKILKIDGPHYAVLTKMRNHIPAHGTLRFDIQLMRPPFGDLNNVIELRTDCPIQSLVSLRLHADVMSRWNLSQRDFYFGFINKTDDVQKSVLVGGLALSDVKKITTNCKGAQVVFAPSTADKTGIVITLIVQGKRMPMGEMNGQVIVETKDPTQPVLRLPVVGAVQDPTDAHCCNK